MTILPESPRQPDVVPLVAALDAYLISLYPADSNHLLDIDALCAPSIRFFVARNDVGRAIGCGALRVDPDAYGEVKRMYVDPAARGQKLGRAILQRLEDEARALTLPCVRLETGIYQPEALALFRAMGYREIGPFGSYHLDRLSIFMEKTLAGA